jgi:F0F1-type ATP synthase membrane subunit b/b'
MQEANDRIRDMMDKATKDAAAAAAEEISRGKAEVAAERERLQRELRLAADDALHKMWEQSAQLATLISTKVVRKQLNESDHRALLGEALAEFRAAAEARKQTLESARA